MSGERLGEYLERPVYLWRIEGRLRDVDGPGVKDAVVLCLASAGIAPKKLEDDLRAIVSGRPLAVVLAGGASPWFEFLLIQLSEALAPHVMSGVCEGSYGEALDVLLNATWPADERFDEWKRYVVVVLEDQDLAKKVKAELVVRLK